MKIIVLGSFSRDIDKVKDKELKSALDKKILQIEKAKNISGITGIKLLRKYQTHYRINIETTKHAYRAGVIVRNNVMWLVRFCPRKKIYLEFP